MHEAVQEATGHRILDAILYILKSGCAWRLLPHDCPPLRTVYHYFRTWRLSGLWERMHSALRERVTVRLRRNPQPSAGARKLANFASAESGLVRLAGCSHLRAGLITFNTNITHLGDAENVGEDDIGFVGNTASKEERRDNRTVGRR
jgi:transposase